MMQTDDEKRLLFVRFSSLGDVIMCSYTAMEIKKAHPNWHLTWLVDSIYADIVRVQPWVDDVIEWNRKKDGNDGFMAIIRQVRRGNFDLLLDMHCSDRSSLFSLLCGISDRRAEEYRYPFTHTRHDLHGLWDETQTRAACPKYLVAPPRNERIGAILEKSRGRRRLALAIGASFAKKRWPIDNWTQFCRLASADGYSMLILGNGDEEKNAAAKIETVAAVGDSIINIVGKVSLIELVQIIDAADMTISGDTGSAHIARALGRPAILMFGPTSIDDKAYVNSFTEVFYCHCHKQGCEEYNCSRPCMETISPQAVYQSVVTHN